MIDKDSDNSNYDKPVAGSIINPDMECRGKSWFQEGDNEFRFAHADLYVSLVYPGMRKMEIGV